MPARVPTCFLCVALVASAAAAAGQELPVFQDLEEVTSRIPNLADKPYKALIDASGGFLQSEAIIFRDVETGHEVWSLSREECWDMAHTGRRPAWSTDGRYISFKGNQVFWNLENNQLWKRTWAGYSYVANADGSRKRPLWATVDGKVRKFNCDKYNMWDVKRPNTWYCTAKGQLWRVVIDDSLTGSRAEAIFTFPNTQPKVIQEISSTLQVLKDMQNQYMSAGRTMTPGETLDVVESVKVAFDTNDPTILRADVAVRALSGRTVNYSQFLKIA